MPYGSTSATFHSLFNVRTLTICLLLVYFVSAAGCHCFDFRTVNENTLHRMGRCIGSPGGGITLQTEKEAEPAVALNAYIYLIMDAQLNIQNRAFVSAVH